MVEDLQNAGIIPVNHRAQRNNMNSFGGEPASQMTDAT
jgi:hypothetical protein